MLLNCALLSADLAMPSIFSNGMVLQADKDIKLWGKSGAGAKVEIDFDGIKKSAIADKSGKWVVHLGEFKASQQPRTLRVYEGGKLAKTISDVLVGEVWICGGQSNMAYRLSSMPAEYAKPFIENAGNLKNVRQFVMRDSALAENPQFDFPEGAKWLNADSKNIRSMYAVPYFFGETIAQKMDVPVGLVCTPMGATKMANWIPEEVVEKNPHTVKQWEKFLKDKSNYGEKEYERDLEKYNRGMKEYARQVKAAKESGKPKPKFRWTEHVKPNRITPWWEVNTPVYFWNAKIAPLAGYTAKGFIWYQGESDASISKEAFSSIFESLICQWRKAWNDDNMPFYCVQLASFDTKANWANARNAQLETSMRLNNCGIVTAIDCGEKSDIHPRYKDIVGRRLGILALKFAYNNKIKNACGPILKDAKYRGKEVDISFYMDNSSLCSKGDLRGIEVLENGKWIPPQKAYIKGNTLKVTGSGEIGGVRYLYKSWAGPDVSLYNTDGLPAFPFCNAK